MEINTLMRLALTVAMSAALASMSFTSHAQHGADVSARHKAEAQQDKQDKQEQKDAKKDAKKHQQQQHRLSQQQQQERIRQQSLLPAEDNQRIAEQQAIALRNAQQLERQSRLALLPLPARVLRATAPTAGAPRARERPLRLRQRPVLRHAADVPVPPGRKRLSDE